MDNFRTVKAISFGWIAGSRREAGGRHRQDFAKAIHRALKDRDIPEVDWYRQAQDRNTWRTRAAYGITENQTHALKQAKAEQESRRKGMSRSDAYDARRMAEKPDARPKGKLASMSDMRKEDGTFHCPACDKVFATQGGFSSHYSKVHGIEELIRSDIGGKHTCEQCGEQFRNQGALTRHINETHNASAANRMCRTCGKICKTTRGLKLYMRTHLE